MPGRQVARQTPLPGQVPFNPLALDGIGFGGHHHFSHAALIVSAHSPPPASHVELRLQIDDISTDGHTGLIPVHEKELATGVRCTGEYPPGIVAGLVRNKGR